VSLTALEKLAFLKGEGLKKKRVRNEQSSTRIRGAPKLGELKENQVKENKKKIQ